ncbi:MAG: putative ABC transporter ATP-binding protein [Acidimicrobiales bacterium]|nr:MAG: putative ABC transporter ATP-binding protein [Acidimicrobiales bacterium]
MIPIGTRLAEGGYADLAVRVSDLHFTYPGSGHPVLRDVNVEVRRGERVALLGPNGAGKSTLLMLLDGLLLPPEGTVTVLGIPVERGNLTRLRRRVGILFQDPDDQLFMPTVEADVAFGPANAGFSAAEVRARVDEALARMGAAHLASRHPHRLSSGEKRRVALAGVLACEPEILLLDEPTAGLDPRGRRELVGLLQELGGTQIVVTHDLEFARSVCDRGLVLDEGLVVADAPIEQLVRDREFLELHGLAPLRHS